ncbi:MAG: corrinoid protein [Acidobacteriia bacterium]|nr:corrinoid protein [Terriglobia bacterium]
MHEETFQAMRQSVLDGAPDHAFELAQRALELGIDPLEAINAGYVSGMNAVGAQYGCGQMFLPDLMASSEAMSAAMSVLEPALRRLGGERPTRGTVVLGTTKGDIHEIGKKLVGTLLAANGFRVHDLGADVASETFAAKAQELNADIVGVSALLTTTMDGQKKVIEALERAGLRPRVKVIVGGAPVSHQWAEQIGADGYGKDAMSAVALAKSLLQVEEPA